MDKCPGAKAFREPKPEFLPCPTCHEEVELWTDEAETKCEHCSGTVSREMLQGCIDHCASARECLGDQLYTRLIAARGRTP